MEQKQKKRMRANVDLMIEKGKSSPSIGNNVAFTDPFLFETKKGSPTLKYQPPHHGLLREAIMMKKQDLQKLIRLIDRQHQHNMLSKRDKHLMDHLIDIKQTDIEVDEYITRSNFEKSVFGILNSQLQNGSPLPLENVETLFHGPYRRTNKPGVSPVRQLINGHNDKLLHKQFIKNFGIYKQSETSKS